MLKCIENIKRAFGSISHKIVHKIVIIFEMWTMICKNTISLAIHLQKVFH
jgi:hypothetical protein